ncbi:hypothetical protein UT300009_30470 [Paraclostridium bifermentans]
MEIRVVMDAYKGFDKENTIKLFETHVYQVPLVRGDIVIYEGIEYKVRHTEHSFGYSAFAKGVQLKSIIVYVVEH